VSSTANFIKAASAHLKEKSVMSQATDSPQTSGSALQRLDFHLATRDGLSIYVREVRPAAPDPVKPVVVLAHGARVPGLGSFDLDVPGGSLAGDLAAAGHVVYLFDARGYGRSTRPPEMDRPAAEGLSVARAWQVIRDLGAVVREALARNGVAQVALLGWATGAMWCGYYASVHPEHVSHVVYYNGLYGGSHEHASLGHGSPAEDPVRPGRFNTAGFGAWRLSTAESLVPNWDKAFDGDPAASRDPAVLAAYALAALDSDPTSHERQPPSFRSPCGASEDSFYQATGRQLFDAASIAARVLIVRSGRDFWSREEDVRTLAAHLACAASVERLDLPGASHYVHLDRDGAGRAAFLQGVREFLAIHSN